ncbi:MAG: hypothetical protein K2W82_05705 [Candidatus Obscuribacterales bacterium]|nr:hypothetical protein [Candidatus Obscuribacterales bacterium]
MQSVAFADEDSFDGSEFNPESFHGANFEKQTYGELPYKKRSDGRIYRADLDRDRGEGLTVFERDKNRLDEDREGTQAYEDKFGKIPTLLRDWVPDEPDLSSNGGFSIAPYNGSPVPYNLNGFVDLQR